MFMSLTHAYVSASRQANRQNTVRCMIVSVIQKGSTEGTLYSNKTTKQQKERCIINLR